LPFNSTGRDCFKTLRKSGQDDQDEFSLPTCFGFTEDFLKEGARRFVSDFVMTIASLKSSATATREVLASNGVRTLIANQLGVDVKRVIDRNGVEAEDDHNANSL
jgi:hypothetical protein